MDTRPRKIVLDTDIGGDIDDVLALALALNSPELELLAVTTVNTDPPMRARIAATMLRAFGRAEVPVAPGLKERFDGSPTLCKDINGAVVVSLNDPVPTGSGVDLLARTLKAHPGEVTVVGIGCWTNIAQAFAREPELADRCPQLVLMGGQIEPPGPESNITCDAAAAAFVLELKVPKLLVPLDVTRHCRYRVAHHGELLSAGTAPAAVVRDLMRAWQIGRHRGDPTAEPILHDPLAVALAFEPSFIAQSVPLCLTVRHPDGGGPPITCPVSGGTPNVQAVTRVDGEAFESFFARRIVGRR